MTTILTNPRERTRFLRFMMVGAVGTVVDFGVSNLLIHVFAFSLEQGKQKLKLVEYC